WLGFAADRRAEVLQLQPVRVGRLELDPLDPIVPPQLDHRHPAMPGIVEEERSFGTDHLQLVPVGKAGPAVELRDHVAGEAQQPRKAPARTGRANGLLPVEALRLPGGRAGAAYAVPADVHEAAAVELRTEPEVARVVEGVAERRADDAQVTDGAAAHELL